MSKVKDIDVVKIVSQISAMAGKRIEPGKTLLFLDEVQACPEAIMSLWFFKEDLPDLHVVAAGSLLEFVLEDLSSFGVGRIHSMFMFPMTFDEFLIANGEQLLMDARNNASSSQPPPPGQRSRQVVPEDAVAGYWPDDALPLELPANGASY